MSYAIHKIQEAVAAEFGVSLNALLSRRQGEGICVPRHEAMRRARSAGASYRQIARAFDRDHTTVLLALKKNGKLSPKSTGFIRPHANQIEGNAVDGLSSHRIEVG